MNMKKLCSGILACAMALTLVHCAPQSVQAANFDDLDDVELIVADSAAPSTAIVLFENLVAEKVDEMTGGKFTLDIHSGGDLGGDADLIRQLQSGDIDAVGCQIAPVVPFIPDLAVFDLPMAFAKYDGDTIDSVLNGEGDFRSALDAAYEANGMHLLHFLQNATYRLTSSNVNLPDLASFSDLQIRTMENANHMAFWTAIGATPTPLAWAEVYVSLQTGLIQAEENSADTILNANLNEVQKYLACTNHILYCNQFSLNKDCWDNLDPAYQEVLVQAIQEASDEIRSQLSELDKTSKESLQEAGMEIIEYPDTFFDEVLALDTVKELYEKIDADTNGLGTILMEGLAK